MNPNEVPADFLSVAEQLSNISYSQSDTYITLIKHAFQSTLGSKYPLPSIHRALQVRAATSHPHILWFLIINYKTYLDLRHIQNHLFFL